MKKKQSSSEKRCIKAPVEMPKHTCCICQQEFVGWGNNPAPLELEGRCCDYCNMTFVLPLRLQLERFYCRNSLKSGA